ncbi:MAG: hypothetical protein ABIA47_05160 [bacterium]
MTKKQKNILGIVLIVYPIPLLVLTLAGYAIASFVIVSIGGEDAAMIGSVIQLLLGICGLAAILGIPIGMPIGIYLLVKNK